MLKKFLLTLFVASVFITTPTLASAHTLKSDGNIGAVIHIDPEDNPIIGEPANFFFEFKDTENKFSAEQCSCLITITKDSQEVFSEQLETDIGGPSLNSASFSYTFPEKGVYKLTLTGNSINAISFPSFKLTYDLRIERENSNPVAQGFLEQNLHFFILGVILVIFLAITLSGKLRKAEA